jgi:hypothetical protein
VSLTLDTGRDPNDDGKCMKSLVMPATLPMLPGLSTSTSDREALLAGLSFTDPAASSWEPSDLLAWFQTYAQALGGRVPPASVSDAVLGVFPLSSASPVAAPHGAATRGGHGGEGAIFPKLLAMARRRIAFTLRGLLAKPADDRFLQAAIFAGRVQRERRGKSSVWAVCLNDGDHLSDIVLSLFVADVLSHREFYEQHLCVCDVCALISFDPAETTRSGCATHLPARDAGSGVRAAKLVTPTTLS